MIHPSIYKREVKLSRTLHVYWFLRCLVSRRHPCRVFARFQPSICYETRVFPTRNGSPGREAASDEFLIENISFSLPVNILYDEINLPVSCTLTNYSIRSNIQPSILDNNKLSHNSYKRCWSSTLATIQIRSRFILYFQVFNRYNNNNRIINVELNISKLANFSPSPLITRPNRKKKAHEPKKEIPSRCRPNHQFPTCHEKLGGGASFKGGR